MASAAGVSVTRNTALLGRRPPRSPSRRRRTAQRHAERRVRASGDYSCVLEASTGSRASRTWRHRRVPAGVARPGLEHPGYGLVFHDDARQPPDPVRKKHRRARAVIHGADPYHAARRELQAPVRLPAHGPGCAARLPARPPTHRLAAADLSHLGKLSAEYISDELRTRHGDTVRLPGTPRRAPVDWKPGSGGFARSRSEQYGFRNAGHVNE